MADAVKNFIGNFIAKLQRSRNVRHTVKELNALTNHELSDIGINRGMIRSIAESSYPPVETKNVSVNTNIRGWV